MVSILIMACNPSKTFQILKKKSRKMHRKFKCWENTIKDVIARDQGASRSIVSASKEISSALRIVNAWNARISKVVMKEGLSFMAVLMPQLMRNRQRMQQLVVPSDHLAMGPLWHPRKGKARNCLA